MKTSYEAIWALEIVNNMIIYGGDAGQVFINKRDNEIYNPIAKATRQILLGLND